MYYRTTVFLYAYAASAASGLLSGPIVYACMKIGPVFAQGCSLVGLFFATLLTLTLPKIEPREKKNSGGTEEETGRSSKMRRMVSDVKEQAHLIFHNLFLTNIAVGFLLVSLIFTTLGRYEVAIRGQYARKRFGWTWAEVCCLQPNFRQHWLTHTDRLSLLHNCCSQPWTDCRSASISELGSL